MDDTKRLLAVQEISQLKPRYWRCVDTKNWPELLDRVFAPDFVADFTGTGGGTYSSAAEVVAMFERALATATTVHLGGACEIELLSDVEATGVWTFTDRIERPSGTTVGSGTSDETYRRTDAGWRIASSRLTRQFSSFERPNSASEIECLIYMYARRLDAGDLEGVAQLFGRGRLAPSRDAAPEQCAAGADEALAWFPSATRIYPEGTPRTKHLTTNVRVDVDHTAGTALAHSYYTVLQQVDGTPLQAIISGSYEDSFHHVEGTWWFDTRIIHVDLVGDLSRHLLFELE